MAIVINELEVIVEPPREPAEAAGVERRRPLETPPHPPLSPADLASIERHQWERAVRLWAH